MGYVGLPLITRLSKNFNVVGYDINKKRIKQLQNGYDVTKEVKIKNRSKIRFTFNKNDLINTDIFIVTVPTPVKKNNLPDLTLLRRACILVAGIIKKKSIIVFESTVYPGCTEEFCAPIIEKNSKFKFNKDFFLGYSPERINPGKTNHKIDKIIKLVSGSTPSVTKIINNIYKKIIPAGTYVTKNIKIAEAAKVIENTQRDINIAFVNELSMIFDKLNINTNEVLEAAATKWNFNTFYPGLVGGHCIGVDPYYLSYKAKSVGVKPNMVLAGRKVNDYLPIYIFRKIKSELIKLNKKISNCKVLILGATFKENCPDFRNSKTIDIIHKLNGDDIFYKFFDPYYSKDVKINERIKSNFIDIKKNNEKFDIILITVAHDFFRNFGIKKIKKKLVDKGKIFDLKSLFNKKTTHFRL